MKVFFLGILLSFKALAAGPFFIESIDLDKKSDWSQLVDKLDETTRESHHLVSLGESHLHPVTSRAVQSIFINRYLSQVADFRFCTETINDFLEHPAGQALQDNAADTLITLKNSPNKTDFRDCRARKYERYFTYSGFFHQLPFARPFPLEIAATPVITNEGENIRDQLNIQNSFYLIQMELEHLEMITQARMLRNPPATLEAFQAKIQLLVEKVEAIKQAQSVILPATNLGRQKEAIVLGHEAFASLENDQAYILLTDLSYRKNLTALPLLTNIQKLSEKAQSILLRKLQASAVYVTQSIQEPNENGELFRTGYGTIPWSFPANSTFMEIRIVPGENLLMTAAPEDVAPSCIAYKSLGASIVDCESYLAGLE